MGNIKKKPIPLIEDLLKSIEGSLFNIKSRTKGEFSQPSFHSCLLALPFEKVDRNMKRKYQFIYGDENEGQKLPAKKAGLQGIDLADSDEGTGDSETDIFTIGPSDCALPDTNSNSCLI